MNRVTRTALGFGAALALALPAASTDRGPASAASLSWLAGCWAYVGAEAGSGETWMPPAGGQLLGVARRVRDGRAVSYEYLRIAEDAGGLALFAQPAGASEVRFGLASQTANEIVFENLAHDFPQRVIYRLAQTGDISARIEGAAGAQPAVEFPMQRASCEQATKR